jgi:hypothetical protein
MAQLHKRFADEQIKELLSRYVKREIKRRYIQEILGIRRRRFCELVKQYQTNPRGFTIQYARKEPTRSIDDKIEKNILKELSIDKGLIANPKVPLRRYNYSYVKKRLERKYGQEVSLSTIIDRAKTYGFYMPRPKKAAHDREVITHQIGELVQHDTSLHLWAPASGEQWYLITSIDDYSRFLLYAMLLKKETSWTHIQALQTVFLKYGLPYTYYVDSHSIFRFVQGRDSFYRTHVLQTDDVDTQWEQVLRDCNVNAIFALSPQAKGKIERPYEWLQDHLVRTCVRENVTLIHQALPILREEVRHYNYRQVHSTTGEVPYFRFQRAQKEKISLFRQFAVKPPYQSAKDIFCLRMDRVADSYRKISLHTVQIKVNGVNPGDSVNLRVYPLGNDLCEVRFWRKEQLIDVQRLKSSDFKGVHF